MTDDHARRRAARARPAPERRRAPAGHRGRRAGGPRSGAARAAGPAARAVGRPTSSGGATSWPPATSRAATASSSCGWPAATGTRPTPTSRRTSSGSCSTTSGPGCRARRWRRWRSSPTSSRSRGPRSRRSAVSTPTACCGRCRAAATSTPSVATPARARPCSTARPDVPREARAGLASTTCRRSPTSSPAPTWSRPSRTGCGSPIAGGRRWRAAGDEPSRRSGSSARSSRPPRPSGPDAERLQKVLATRGWGSRRVCEDLIAAGRVTVNGEVAVLGRRVDPDVDLVEVDGAPVGTKPGLVYYLLNKPVGRRHHGQGHPRAPDRRRAGARPSRGCSRSAGSTPTPRASCC